MEVELVLVRLGHVQDLHVAALHADGQPLPRGTVAQREDLGEKAESGPRKRVPARLALQERGERHAVAAPTRSGSAAPPTWELKSCC